MTRPPSSHLATGRRRRRVLAVALLLLAAGVMPAAAQRDTIPLSPDTSAPLGPGGGFSSPLGPGGGPGNPLAPRAVPGAADGSGSGPRAGLPGVPAGNTNAPVTFTADEVEYDREKGIVTARGHVEAWQDGRLLRTDVFTYDRNTGVATATGNVQILEADGQVMFADSAELKDRFRDGVLQAVSALLAANGKLVANGATRTGGTINEMSRVVYSACDLCADDPTRAPLWQVEARRATQDKDALRISYRDAVVRMFGVPVIYTPYFSHPDPSAPRASGFMFPTFGATRLLGGFTETPYYWAIDNQSDLLITPIFSTKVSPNLGAEYRRLFNSGSIVAGASVGYFSSNAAGTGPGTKDILSGHIFVKGRFTVDENWRVGFDLNRASNELYLRTYRYIYNRTLNSRVFAEGFWDTEAYALLDSRAYQGLRSSDDTRQVPFVVPNLYYERAPREKIYGGNLTMDVGLLGISRTIGSQSQRLATRALWERPEIGPLGDLWTFKIQGDGKAYHAQGQQYAPINLPDANGDQAIGNVRAAVDWRMPLVRSAGSWGSQTIEPRVQLVTGPRVVGQSTVPNEDSVDFEFTDANLFALNRNTGRDRQEGGSRVDAAMRGAWDFPNGGQVEALVGRSFRLDNQIQSPYSGSGLDHRASDYVAKLRVAPVGWFDMVGRVRTDGSQPLDRRFADAVATLSAGNVSVYGGYLWSPPVPYLNPVRQRDEFLAGTNVKLGEFWRIGFAAKYDLVLDRPAVVSAGVTYEDECFVIEGRFFKRYAQDPLTLVHYQANTVLLVRINFKTLGQYFFRAI